MTTGGNSNDDGSVEPAKLDESLILDLNFVPQWARKEPGAVRYDEPRGRDGRDRGRDGRDWGRRDDRRDRRGGDRRPSRPRDERPRDGRRGPSPRQTPRQEPFQTPGQEPRRPDAQYERPRDAGVPERRFERPPGRPDYMRRESLPVRVRILPDQRKLSAVVRKIRMTRRAYPLADLAGLILAAPDSCYVKIDPVHDDGDVSLFQCRTCGAVALERTMLAAHASSQHIGEFFDREEKLDDPPSGQFTCVARCGLSGTILGPPNHHSYNDKLREVHRARFSNMSLEDYRSRIENVNDSELVERWKEESRHRVVYRMKQNTGADAPDELNWSEADEYFRTSIAPGLVKQVKNASLPISAARDLGDPRLRAAFNMTWDRENRFPRSLTLALRAAFRHMRLHVFRAGTDLEFVASISPVPLDPEFTVDSIREVLLFLREHPGCKRAELIGGLHPDMAPDSPDAARVLAPLGWLIEKGHIIEFFDGSLSVPLTRRA